MHTYLQFKFNIGLLVCSPNLVSSNRNRSHGTKVGRIPFCIYLPLTNYSLVCTYIRRWAGMEEKAKRTHVLLLYIFSEEGGWEQMGVFP